VAAAVSEALIGIAALDAVAAQIHAIGSLRSSCAQYGVSSVGGRAIMGNSSSRTKWKWRSALGRPMRSVGTFVCRQVMAAISAGMLVTFGVGHNRRSWLPPRPTRKK